MKKLTTWPSASGAIPQLDSEELLQLMIPAAPDAGTSIEAALARIAEYGDQRHYDLIERIRHTYKEIVPPDCYIWPLIDAVEQYIKNNAFADRIRYFSPDLHDEDVLGLRIVK